MFAPLIAKPQTRDAARSTNKLAQSRSRQSTGNQATLWLLRQWGARQTRNEPVNYEQKADGLSHRPSMSWDFSKIPVFARDRPKESQTKSRVTGGVAIQPKLAGGSVVDDPLEREADVAAERVTRMPVGDFSLAAAPTQVSTCKACEEERLDRKPEGIGTDAAPRIINEVLRSPGRALDASTRAYFEAQFERDFSSVRVHLGASAERSAQDLAALAYTVGHEIVFGAGQFAPGTQDGRRLIAHELAHVVQQTGATQARSSAAIPGPLTPTTPVIARNPDDRTPPPSRSEGLTSTEWAKLMAVRKSYNLPERPTKSRTTIVGILIDESEEEFPVKSGEEGGVAGGAQRGGIPRGRGEAFTGGGMSQGNIAAHVEGQALAIMHQRKIMQATLLVEEPPCEVCDNPRKTPNITVALPSGAKLTVVDPKATGTYWSSQRPAPVTGPVAPVTPTAPPRTATSQTQTEDPEPDVAPKSPKVSSGGSRTEEGEGEEQIGLDKSASLSAKFSDLVLTAIKTWALFRLYKENETKQKADEQVIRSGVAAQITAKTDAIVDRWIEFEPQVYANITVGTFLKYTTYSSMGGPPEQAVEYLNSMLLSVEISNTDKKDHTEKLIADWIEGAARRMVFETDTQSVLLPLDTALVQSRLASRIATIDEQIARAPSAVDTFSLQLMRTELQRKLTLFQAHS